ncbi:MAG: hypothetical protein AAF242_00810 [Bacteroidota bacterium]
MKNLVLLLLISATTAAFAQTQKVAIVEDAQGMKLTVDGQAIILNGMNWDYYPIGKNYEFSLWAQSDEFIKTALEGEMSLLKDMGVNVLRIYTGIQPRWITYIYEQYGIYTMLNHSFGRYGLSVDGKWMPNTEYGDPGVRKVLLAEVTTLAEEYKNTPGLLFYLLGNENNYGLFWEGAETEDIPEDDPQSEGRARAMYKLFNEAAKAMQGIDASHPVAMCNGEVQFLDIIAEECKDVDIFGANVYRGVSFGDFFQSVKDGLGKPVFFAEFGGDAYDALKNEEDQFSQAYYNLGNWKEVYENAAGMGKVGNSLGGFTFQYSDGWWKFGQTKNLDVHDNNASWDNGGYAHDFVKGKDNMNEEWFGICGKGPTNNKGLYQLYPRASYYALKEAHTFNPFASGASQESLKDHFEAISLKKAAKKGKKQGKALLKAHAKK